MSNLTALHWQMFLRGAVAGLLLHHVVDLAMPGPRAAARWTLAAFAASILCYLFCQQPLLLLEFPRPLAWLVLAGCVTSTAWLWAAARALCDDRFNLGWPVLPALAAMLAIGLAANLPHFPQGDGPFRTFGAASAVVRLGRPHGLAMLAFSFAALWEVARGWQADMVAARRAARRWVAMGIGLYAVLALVVEPGLRGQDVGPLLPSLHVAGIGAVALALSVIVARGSLADVLGTDLDEVASPVSAPTQGVCRTALPDRTFAALSKLDDAMTREHAYRREGLTLAELDRNLAMSEASRRELINQRLGFRNFNDFLHHHRLQEAAARLVTEDLPILTIALECGYGSIGPFNPAYRQRLAMTPTEYRAAARVNGKSA